MNGIIDFIIQIFLRHWWLCLPDDARDYGSLDMKGGLCMKLMASLPVVCFHSLLPFLPGPPSCSIPKQIFIGRERDASWDEGWATELSNQATITILRAQFSSLDQHPMSTRYTHKSCFYHPFWVLACSVTTWFSTCSDFPSILQSYGYTSYIFFFFSYNTISCNI